MFKCLKNGWGKRKWNTKKGGKGNQEIFMSNKDIITGARFT